MTIETIDKQRGWHIHFHKYVECWVAFVSIRCDSMTPVISYQVSLENTWQSKRSISRGNCINMYFKIRMFIVQCQTRFPFSVFLLVYPNSIQLRNASLISTGKKKMNNSRWWARSQQRTLSPKYSSINSFDWRLI